MAALTSNERISCIKGVAETETSSSSSQLKRTEKKDLELSAMEILISVLVGELVTRSMSSIISRCFRKEAAEAMEADLERILLRGQVIVDEAAGRHVTNQAVLRQLTKLRDAMFQGYYVLDAFRCRRRSYHDDDDSPEDDRHASQQRRLQICLSSSSCRGGKRRSSRGLEEILHGLRSMIEDAAAEMTVFLATYPRLCRQPYSMHLLLDKCMFGRQMELQMVINFLLDKTAPPCSSNGGRFDVLPIVGPGVVGKSTLVAHVCEDERVRDHFSQILFFSHGSFRGAQDIAALTDRFAAAAAAHENSSSSSNGGRLLVVVDIAGDIDDDLYDKLSSLCHQCITTTGSKIILTSRSDKISNLGTAQTLTLHHLSPEAYWYYFKLATFGSSDPGDHHPKLGSLAMEMARIHNGSLFSASITASLLRTNLTVQFWSRVLAFLKGYLERHFAVFGEHPSDILEEKRPMRFQRMGAAADAIDFLIVDQYQTCSSSSSEEVPEVTFVDVMYGGVRPPDGPFKVLAWRSPIPPHHRFIYSCEIRELEGDRAAAAKRKRAAGSALAQLV